MFSQHPTLLLLWVAAHEKVVRRRILNFRNDITVKKSLEQADPLDVLTILLNCLLNFFPHPSLLLAMPELLFGFNRAVTEDPKWNIVYFGKALTFFFEETP